MDILTSLRPVPESISYVFGGYVDMFWGGKHNLTEALIANKLYHRGYGIINLTGRKTVQKKGFGPKGGVFVKFS